MPSDTLLLAQKVVRGHQYRLIYSARFFHIQRAVPRKSSTRVDWETVHSEQLQDSALEFWHNELTEEMKPARLR